MLVRSVCVCMRVRVEKAEHRKIFVMTFSSDISVFYQALHCVPKEKKNRNIMFVHEYIVPADIRAQQGRECIKYPVYTCIPSNGFRFFSLIVQEKTFNPTAGGRKHITRPTESRSAVCLLAL